ncbi:MAG: IS30 family transposase [Propionibacteriaceae bacterium]
MTFSMEVRRRAFVLLARGLPMYKVGLELGVSRETISVWRAEVGGVIREPRAESGRYLSRDERYEIARLHELKVKVREIGRRMGRSGSTISRELRRAERPRGARGRPATRCRGYQPEANHQAAVRARSRPRDSKLSLHPLLRDWVQDRLDEKFSPEQITGRLLVAFPDDEQMRISHETIYQAVYIRPRGELRRELRAHLRTGRAGRRRRNTRQARTVGKIVGAVPIGERPAEVEGRLLPGHYEGDLVVGPVGTTAAIGTLVERTSGHLTTFHLPLQRTAAATTAGLTTALTRTGWPMQSLTWDRGLEMAHHASFTLANHIKVYFADPYAPWQRGTNESTNGLLREYFPKGLDLATVTDADIQAATDQLNNRPRKRHGFLTPNEVLAKILEQDQQSADVATTA